MAISKSRIYTVAASAARTSSGSALLGPVENFDEAHLILDVTAASGTAPTLDVAFQVSLDGGTTWLTHTSFTQKTTTGNELKQVTNIGILGRLSWTIAGTNPSFTFSIMAGLKSTGM